MNPDDINEASLLINPDDVCFEFNPSVDYFPRQTVYLQAPKGNTGTFYFRVSRKTKVEERKILRKFICRFKKLQTSWLERYKRVRRLFKKKLRMEQRRGYKGKGCRNRNLRNVKSCQSMSSFHKRWKR